jgi:hypothetical protein
LFAPEEIYFYDQLDTAGRIDLSQRRIKTPGAVIVANLRDTLEI